MSSFQHGDRGSLVDAFVVGHGTRVAEERLLAETLTVVVARARAAWPDIVVEPATFARAIGERLAGEPDAVASLGALHAEDLYVACAAVNGDATALRALDQRYLARLAEDLRRNGALAPYAEEAQQMLRVRLFVGADGEPPRLVGYRGTGPLVAWLRLTLTRLAINLHNAATRASTLDEDMMRGQSGERDPELLYLREHFREVVHEAMRAAFEALSAEERAILRMHFLDGLSAADVGAMFHVSGRTIQRRIVETRRQILDGVRRALGARAGLRPSQTETLMRLVQSDLHLSLRRILE